MLDIVPVILVSNEAYYLPYVLKSLEGYFKRYVIYDIGSTDGTVDIIRWFVESNQDCEFIIKLFPLLDPKVQGSFRNSMQTEAMAHLTFMVDGDEIYTKESLTRLCQHAAPQMLQNPDKNYGVVRRIELVGDLTQAYGRTTIAKHHRIYKLPAPFSGTHPGEVPIIPQNRDTQLEFSEIECFHFHGTPRSPSDHLVPKRLERRGRGTYTPGELLPIDVLEHLPILREPIENFPVSPELKALQDKYHGR